MISSNRDTLDKLFSLVTKFKYATHEGYGKCYTCPAVLPFRAMECGHFQSRQYYPVRWHKNNARLQCYSCNNFFSGRPDVFEEELREEIGDEEVDIILHLAKNGAYPTDDEIKQQIKELRLQLKALGGNL